MSPNPNPHAASILAYRNPVTPEFVQPPDSQIRMQSLLARILLAASISILIFCLNGSAPGGMKVGEFFLQTLDLAVKPSLLLCHGILLLSLLAAAFSPGLLWIRRVTKSRGSAVMAALPVLQWFSIPYLQAASSGGGMPALLWAQLAMTLISLAILLQPRLGQEKALPSRLCDVLAVFFGLCAGMFYAIDLCLVIDYVSSSAQHGDHLAHDLEMLPVYLIAVPVGLFVGGKLAFRSVSKITKSTPSHSYGVCEDLGLERQPQGEYEMREPLE